jgi:uncharacterized coiled-coil DUF342 family protein
MLTPDERKAVHAQLDELQPRINALRQQLKELYDQKEKLFQQHRARSKEISQHIKTIKQLKQERDTFTHEVKALKGSRTWLNTVIFKDIEQAKKLNAEKRKSTAKLGVKENPAKFKMLMDKLETKLETEAMSFEREKELMKEIKDLKKRYEAARTSSVIWDTAKQLSKEIDVRKEQADEIHGQIQQKAKASQEKHEMLVEESKKVEALKKKNDDIGKDVDARKAEMAKLGAELDALQKQAGELRAKLSAERKEQEHEQEQARAKKFSEKLAEVKAKMAKGGKLTTEDIIILQGEK